MCVCVVYRCALGEVQQVEHIRLTVCVCVCVCVVYRCVLGGVQQVEHIRL